VTCQGAHVWGEAGAKRPDGNRFAKARVTEERRRFQSTEEKSPVVAAKKKKKKDLLPQNDIVMGRNNVQKGPGE